jgi:hydrogenase-4 membrane subunit HyfE
MSLGFGWSALGLVLVGALIIVVAAVLANIVLVRYSRSTHGLVTRHTTDVALATSLLLCATLSFVGATLLVLGLIVGNGTAAWTLLIPLGLLVLATLGVGYLKRGVR